MALQTIRNKNTVRSRFRINTVTATPRKSPGAPLGNATPVIVAVADDDARRQRSVVEPVTRNGLRMVQK
jgi:hypothetical protein